MPPVPPPLPDPETTASGTVAGAADAMEDQQAAAREALLASKPEMKPVSVKVVGELADALTKVIQAVDPRAPEVPRPAAMAINGGKPEKTFPSVPDDLYLRVAAIAQLLKLAEGGAYAGKYELDPTELADEKGVRRTSNRLDALAKNKKCIKAIQEFMGGPAPEEEEPVEDEKEPPKGDHPLSETGRALAAAMP